jgi:hypothetical protein
LGDLFVENFVLISDRGNGLKNSESI